MTKIVINLHCRT